MCVCVCVWGGGEEGNREKRYINFKHTKGYIRLIFKKKVTQHDYDRLYFFNHGFIFVMSCSIDALFVMIVSLGRVWGE